MKNSAQPDRSPEAARLRRAAEQRLEEQHLKTAPVRSDADTERLLHELQVHQIELEMQNEELQQVRNELEAAAEKYCDLYDFAPVGYVTLDTSGTICEANLASTALLGVERSRLLRRRFALFVAESDRPAVDGFLQRIFKCTTRESCELSLLSEGRPPVEVRLEAAMVASGRECRLVIEDMTEQKRAEADRLILSKLESTGILAGGLAHDFNNLLAVILLNLEQARAFGAPDTELMTCLDDARQASLSACSLTRRLITFADGGAPVREETCLAVVIRDAVRLGVSDSTVHCEVSLADDLWKVEADGEQMGQVFRNLLLNAREAMSERGLISIRAENELLESQQDLPTAAKECVRVTITDAGHGISKQTLNRIFDPYFSTKQRGADKGMGLGLTICQSIVRKHGGKITVESVVGKGTTFHVHLPACRNSPAKAQTSAASTQRLSLKILLIEHDQAMRKEIKSILERMGHTVELMEDGRLAAEEFLNDNAAGRAFDVAILDLTVWGDLGGVRALRVLRMANPAIKAIVLSNHAGDPIVLNHEAHGFHAALIKPVAPEELAGMLARFMRD